MGGELQGLRVRKRYVYSTRKDADPTSLYKYHQRQKEGRLINKDEVRGDTIIFLDNWIRKHKLRPVRFLTLPGPWWTFEKDIEINRHEAKRFNPLFVGCENDYKVFKVAALNMPNRDFGLKAHKYNELVDAVIIRNRFQSQLICCDIFDYVKVSQMRFDCVWLDVTSTLIKVGANLTNFNRVLKQKAVFIITAIKAREPVPIPNRVKYMDKLMGELGFKLEQVYEYQDSQTPMIHLIFSRE